MIEALSFTSTVRTVGDVWPLRVLTTTSSGEPGPAPVITITGPDGVTTTPTVDTTDCSGVFESLHTLTFGGRYVGKAVDGDGVAVHFTCHTDPIVGHSGMPTVADVDVYIGDHSWTPTQVAEVLAQESAAQRARCRIPAAYPADLRGALLRRCQRALALRHLPLAVKETADGESSMVVPGNDPEVRRLEAPHRKVTVG
jgi:hypothetical protein